MTRKMTQVKNIVSGVAKLANKYNFSFNVSAFYVGDKVYNHEIVFRGPVFKNRDIWLDERAITGGENGRYITVYDGTNELTSYMNETETLEFLDKYIGDLENM